MVATRGCAIYIIHNDTVIVVNDIAHPLVATDPNVNEQQKKNTKCQKGCVEDVTRLSLVSSLLKSN